jgi:hypothetical protein
MLPHAKNGAKFGRISYLNPDGLAHVSSDSDVTLPFTFDKIANYRGERPRSIGLKTGARVKFTEDEGKITEVEIVR